MLIAMHALAAASVLIVLPGTAGVLLAAALLALGVAAARSRALMKAGGSVRANEVEGKTQAVLQLANGERLEVQLGERRFASRFLVNIPVVRPARRTILVFRDMLAEDSFRRLRIWALWGKLPGVAGKQLPS